MLPLSYSILHVMQQLKCLADQSATTIIKAILADPSAINIVEWSIYRLAATTRTRLQRFLLPRRVALDPYFPSLRGEVLSLNNLFAAAAALVAGPLPPGGEASGVYLSVGSVVELLIDNFSTFAPAFLQRPHFPLLVALITNLAFFSVVILTVNT